MEGRIVRKCVVVFLSFLILIPLSFSFITLPVKAQSSQWLEGWQYRKRHFINPSSGAGTGYQVNITVYYGSGTDDKWSVYLNGKCKPDFSDIRFTDDDGTTLLSCWAETIVSQNYAKFWVRINDNLNSSTVMIFLYYGNPYASPVWSLNNTFVAVVPNLVLSLPMDEGSGNILYDKSGNNFNATSSYYTFYAIINNCEDLNGWSIEGSGGSLSLDTDCLQGSYSVKASWSVAQSGQTYKLIYQLSSPISLPNVDRMIAFWLKLPVTYTSFSTRVIRVYSSGGAYEQMSISPYANYWGPSLPYFTFGTSLPNIAKIEFIFVPNTNINNFFIKADWIELYRKSDTVWQSGVEAERRLINFNGASYCYVAHNTLLSPASELTIMLKFKLRTSQFYTFIADKIIPYGYSLLFVSPNIRFYGHYSDTQSFSLGSSYQINTTYYVAGTFKRNDKIRLFINGSKVDEQTAQDKALYQNTNAFRIGEQGWFNGLNRRMDGYIWDLRVFNRTLTEMEISYICSSGYRAFEIPTNTEARGKTLVRKYVYPEPQHGSWGGEETRYFRDVSLQLSFSLSSSRMMVANRTSSLLFSISTFSTRQGLFNRTVFASIILSPNTSSWRILMRNMSLLLRFTPYFSTPVIIPPPPAPAPPAEEPPIDFSTILTGVITILIVEGVLSTVNRIRKKEEKKFSKKKQ